MAMLADVKRKPSWVLNPRSSDWSRDQNKLGQKMLEKMGWSAGKGLGAKEQGPVDAIRVTHKANVRGLGAGRKKEQEYWLYQQENFQSLLQQLNGGEDQSVEIKSLEHKSRTSKTRVHYHKFTRGKDISRYSKKDLSCIVGGAPLPKVLKGSLNSEEVDTTRLQSHSEERDSSEGESAENMQLRSRTVQSSANIVADDSPSVSTSPPLKSKKIKKSKKTAPFVSSQPTEHDTEVASGESSDVIKLKRGAKKKKEVTNEVSDQLPKKRSRKRQHEVDENVEELEADEYPATQNQTIKGKEKKKKKAARGSTSLEQVENTTQVSLTKKTLKELTKKKNKESEGLLLPEVSNSSFDLARADREDAETDVCSLNSQSSLLIDLLNKNAPKTPSPITVPDSVRPYHILSQDSADDVNSVEEALTGVPKVKRKKKSKK